MRIEHIGDAAQITSIYALCDYPSWRVRYIGKTVKYIHERHKAHIRSAQRGSDLPVHRWIRKKLQAREWLAIKLIEYVNPNDDWAVREQYWISHYRSHTGDILNLTTGGEGLPGHLFSFAHRQKIASALRCGANFRCERCGSEFYRKPSAIKRGQARFCSRICSNSRHRKVAADGT